MKSPIPRPSRQKDRRRKRRSGLHSTSAKMENGNPPFNTSGPENTYRSFSKVKNDFTGEQRDGGWVG